LSCSPKLEVKIRVACKLRYPGRRWLSVFLLTALETRELRWRWSPKRQMERVLIRWTKAVFIKVQLGIDDDLDEVGPYKLGCTALSENIFIPYQPPKLVDQIRGLSLKGPT